MGLNARDDGREGIEKHLAGNPNARFVAWRDGAIVGAILSGRDGRRGRVSRASAAESARMRGVGRRLVESAPAALKEEGINKVAAVVFARNGDGNAFRERLGFAPRPDLACRDKVLVESERIDT
ncbi:MAG: GNAT family N-acetyltransferase [Deltaproteobacteria bacterium]|nr:GNAT family N-acetyltransferase [Deltaproteobacteria bacterium]